MNCQRFESVVGDLARGQMMEADVRSEVLAHTAECSECGKRMRHEELLSQKLRSLAVEMNGLAAPVSVESDLLKAFRQPKNVPAPVVLANHSYRRYWLTAIAALLLIVFSVVAVRWRGERDPKHDAVNRPDPVRNELAVQPKEEKQEQAAVPKKEQPAKPKHRFTSSSLQAQNRPTRNKNNNVVSNHAEVATDFIPLGYMSVASLQEGGQVVRVEVPRSTLVSFGMPVNMDRYNERVKADIIVGVDGMAHAIRFVQEKRVQ